MYKVKYNLLPRRMLSCSHVCVNVLPQICQQIHFSRKSTKCYEDIFKCLKLILAITPPALTVVGNKEIDQWNYLNCDDTELWSRDNPGQFSVAEVFPWIEW